MNAWLIGVVVIVLICLGWFAWEVNHAPEGYQDDTGFHYGGKR